uniref:armadillo repeat-containing kinesin-like protein 1 isoform X2 n=1 Tax=Fragaria vesca subsp. vesca TaxID=101020 RepID=UPI0005C8AFF1|nr:PREDICTED: armadillo repeat-containing kinesin-like protein 1 isoform X2 [Fragaria vesca subsp. vesca]
MASSSLRSSQTAAPSNGGGVGRSERQQRQTTSSSVRSKPAPPSATSRRSVTPTSRLPNSNSELHQQDAGRVRVAVRVRPRNDEDRVSDSDYGDSVEVQPELKRLKLRKNNWMSESYRFDEIFTETASQNRVYQVVAKPVVESVLNGYNGTVMAYGQTGTGKTYTLGRMGCDDASERGIMVRALEDIILSTAPESDTVEVSYLQLYMESIQDLLAPEKTNIPIHEDPKTGEVSLPGASVVRIKDLDHFLQLLQIGEANRHAANTNLNTESSRSHAILMVFIRRSVEEKSTDEIISQEKALRNGLPIIRRSKLLIVDLAGSERVDKSGSEGHLLEEAKFINLSLTSLGKCINALAENSPHIPTRDSKLTRLLRDSFGGTARTSLIITIGPSARHYAETSSTVMFGQRAMKIVNTVKLKEEFDYESQCRKLENQIDNLTAEFERQLKLRDSKKYELERRLTEFQHSFAEAKENLITRSEVLEKENTRLELEMKDLLYELNNQKEHHDIMHDKVAQLEMSLEQGKVESSTYQKILADTTQMYEEKIAKLMKQLEDEHTCSGSKEDQLDAMRKLLTDSQKTIQRHEMEHSTYQKALADTTQMYERKIAELMEQLEDECSRCEDLNEQFNLAKKLRHQQSSMKGKKEIDELKVKLQDMKQLHELTLNEFQSLKSDYSDLSAEKARLDEELQDVKQRLLAEEKKRKTLENELVMHKKDVPEKEDDFEDKKSYMKENIYKGSSTLGNPMGLHNSNPSRESLSSHRETPSSQRATIAKICEEVGLQKIVQLMTSEDLDVQTHAVKMVANLAAEDMNQEKIMEEGGLDALLMLLQSSQNTTILRVASGAIANLAMNEVNQGLIMSKGGAQLLAGTASKTNDPQTLRMVAGALANLCGNERLHMMLKEDGGIKALLEMARSGSSDVIAQVARGMANFAKCESRGTIQGHRKGHSLLLEDGALTWLISNSSTTSSSTKRHIELALCHLAQNEDNANDFIFSGGLKELVRISAESSREDIRNLAKKTLRSSPKFQTEIHAE